MKEVLKKVKMRLPAVYLLAATLLFWGLYDRYEPVGSVLLESPVLADASRVRGDCVETNSVFTLNKRPTVGKSPDVRFVLSDVANYDFIRLSGRIRTENVVRGKYAWSCARLVLSQRDKNGKWVPASHSLLSEEGSRGWKKQVNEFEMEPATATAEVVLQQIGVSGLAQFDSLKAMPVQLKSSLPFFRIIFALAWVGMGLFYFRRCRLHQRRLKVLILLNAIAILIGTLMPSEWIQDSSEAVKRELVKTFAKSKVPEKFQSSEKSSSKPAQKPERESLRMDQFNEVVGGAHRAGHFMLFASLCFLVYLSAAFERQHPVYFAKVALDILLFAAVSESLQHLTLDRTAGIHDWLIDVYGMLTAFVVFLIVQAGHWGWRAIQTERE